MLISDMQKKDIVNARNGTRLGKIIDVDINNEGVINSFIVGETRLMKRFTNNEYKITIKDIKTIGTDVILVEIN